MIHSTLMPNKVNSAKDYVKKVDQYILYNQKIIFSLYIGINHIKSYG